MPEVIVNDVAISYRVIGGSRGAWIALFPGGRRGYAELVPLAQKVAARGNRVLLQDRRNCGASDFRIDDVASEYEMLGDDLVGLGKALGIEGLYLGGSSSGARLSLVTAIRYPCYVRGLTLWNMTANGTATTRLAEVYYGQYIEVARRGGMAAVAETEHFRESIAQKAINRERILNCDAGHFISVMERWKAAFLAGGRTEIIDAPDVQLATLEMPICVVAGNDVQHAPRAAFVLAQKTKYCEVHDDVVPRHDPLQASLNRDEWRAAEGRLAEIVASFLEKTERRRVDPKAGGGG